MAIKNNVFKNVMALIQRIETVSRRPGTGQEKNVSALRDSALCLLSSTDVPALQALPSNPYPDCHTKWLFKNLCSLTYFDEPPLISCIRSERDWSGLIPKHRWTWSGIPLMANSLCLFAWTIPVIYLYKSSSHSACMRFTRLLTAKIAWMWICV